MCKCLRLEEEVAVVYHVSLQVKLVHETAGSLHSHLAQLLSLLLLVELSTLALLLREYLEQIGCTITLHNGGAELTLLNGGNGTTQSGLAATNTGAEKVI